MHFTYKFAGGIGARKCFKLHSWDPGISRSPQKVTVGETSHSTRPDTPSTIHAHCKCDLQLEHVTYCESDAQMCKLHDRLFTWIYEVQSVGSRVYCWHFQLHRPIWPFESDSKLKSSFGQVLPERGRNVERNLQSKFISSSDLQRFIKVVV